MKIELNVVVSIIVPVYRVEEYLAICIDSLLQQTYPYLEIILVDDGSPDQCPAICDAYAGKDSRVSVIHQENKGESVARNTAMKKAAGKYILFVDSDDVILPDACEHLVQCAENYSADFVAGHYVNVDESGRLKKDMIQKRTPKQSSKQIRDGQTFLLEKLKAKTYECMVWQNLYQRELLVNNSLYFIPEIMREDEEWMPRVLSCAKRVAELEKPFYQYRLCSQSIMHNDALAVRRQLDFIDVVAPAVKRSLRAVNSTLNKMVMHDLLRVFLTDLAVHWRYFAIHPGRLSLSFWKPFAYDRKSRFWLGLLRINAALFALVWNIRAKMKT